MKFISIIIGIVIFSACSQLEEKTSPLSGIYYVLEGWDEFMAGDYDRANELFSTTILGDDKEYFSYAYVGLAWTAVYYANVLPGIDNKIQRQIYRDSAIDYFSLAAKNILDTTYNSTDTSFIPSIQSSRDSTVLADLLAGRAYNYSYMAKKYEIDYFGDGQQDSSIWNEVQKYSQLVISESDSLISFFPNYNFAYDDSFDIDDIYWLRAQTYAKLGQIEDVKESLNKISSFECNYENIYDCLNNTPRP